MRRLNVGLVIALAVFGCDDGDSSGDGDADGGVGGS
jgi:hypothetical protein